MAQKIRIISKRDGFRRCGRPHSENATFHDLDAFTDAEFKRLAADPMLIVDKVEVGEDDKTELERPAKPKAKPSA